jgi:hypothetical protein
MLDPNAYVPVSYISPEACALLVAAETAAARRADALDAGMIELGLNGVAVLQGAQGGLDGWYDPDRVLQNMAPPKRFYRVVWKSMALKLLDQSSRTSLNPMRRVA